MFSIAYKDYGFQIKKINGTGFIFDSIRHKWVVLTPEEWVRQNFIQYLIREKGCPVSHIAIEKQIITHENKSRFDIVVYDQYLKPWLIAECKSQQVPLTATVLQQVLNYQSVVQCKYLFISNGDRVAGWLLSNNPVRLAFVPDYGA